MKFIYEQIAKPILRRIGTLLAAYLAAQAVSTETIDVIVNGFLAGGLVSIDLIMSYMERRKRAQ